MRTILCQAIKVFQFLTLVVHEHAPFRLAVASIHQGHERDVTGVSSSVDIAGIKQVTGCMHFALKW